MGISFIMMNYIKSYEVLGYPYIKKWLLLLIGKFKISCQWWTLVLGYRYWPKIQALQRPRPRNHQHRWPNPSIRRPLVSKPLANSGAETIRNRRGKDETEIHWSSEFMGNPGWHDGWQKVMTLCFFVTILVDNYGCLDDYVYLLFYHCSWYIYIYIGMVSN